MSGVFTLKFSFGLGAYGQIVNRIGNPLGSRFDEGPAQSGKFLRHPLINQIVECADGWQFEALEDVLPELIVVAKIPGPGVHANRQVEPLRLIVHREQ